MAASAVDLDLALAILPAADRETVARWLDVLGVDDLAAVPGLRLVVTQVAIVTLAANMPGVCATDAYRFAAEELGLNVPDDARKHPADDLLKTLRRWRTICPQPNTDVA